MSDATSQNGLAAAFALLQVLVQTFSCIGLGFVCATLGYIDREGDLKGVRFLVSRVALPLLVFKIIATGDLGVVDMGIIASCTCGKIVVYLLTFAMTFFAYRTSEPFGRRLLRASIFSFFTTASNDLAIGFPVINAIYGERMSVYIAANVLIFQSAIQPISMILFEVAGALIPGASPVLRCASDPQSVGSSSMLSRAATAIVFNPILIATASGLVYATVWGHTLVGDSDGGLKLPQPIRGIIELWTSPFVMLFLFLNGTSLRSARVALWPAVLVLMKVVVCAYVSYGFSYIFADPNHPDAQALKDFTFFYGTIPAGGAPLIFAQAFDSGVDVVAPASLFCLVLSGPIEFMTSLFLGSVVGPVDYDDVHIVQSKAAKFGCFGSALFILFQLMGWWGIKFSSRAIGAYGCVTLLLELWTLYVVDHEPASCVSKLTMFVFRFLQNCSYVLVLYIEYRLGKQWGNGSRSRAYVVFPLLVLLALIPSFLVVDSNTFHELCGGRPHKSSVAILVCWNAVLFIATLALAIRGRLLKQHATSSRVNPLCGGTLHEPLRQPCGPRTVEGISVDGGASFPLAARTSDDLREGQVSKAPYSDGVSTALVLLQGVRLIMQIINSASSWDRRRLHLQGQGFTPMIILSTVLEHGQGLMLFTTAFFQPCFLANLERFLAGLAAYGCCGVELARHGLESPAVARQDMFSP